VVQTASVNIVQVNFRIFITFVLKYLTILSKFRLKINTVMQTRETEALVNRRLCVARY
jgi:hypothetical protein